MHYACSSHSFPFKSYAKWLLLSMAFVWLVGCSAMHNKKMAKRDPFADHKFSCGETFPESRARAPLNQSTPINYSAAGGSNMGYSNQSYARTPAAGSGNTNSTRYNVAKVNVNDYGAARQAQTGGSDIENVGYSTTSQGGNVRTANASQGSWDSE